MNSSGRNPQMVELIHGDGEAGAFRCTGRVIRGPGHSEGIAASSSFRGSSSGRRGGRGTASATRRETAQNGQQHDKPQQRPPTTPTAGDSREDEQGQSNSNSASCARPRGTFANECRIGQCALV